MTIPTPRERADDTAALTYPNRQSAHHNALSITIRLAIEADRRALLAEVEAVTDRFDDAIRMLRKEAANALADVRREALETAAKLVVEACDRDNDSELAERAAYAYNSGSHRTGVAERLMRHGAVVAAAIRALSPQPTGEKE
jgi:hypothetical protein